jgi:hypothetical protein
MANGLDGENVTLIGGLMVMLRPLVEAVLPTESTNLTVNGYVPAVVGGPAVIDVVVPVAALKLKPGGRLPALTDQV